MPGSKQKADIGLGLRQRLGGVCLDQHAVYAIGKCAAEQIAASGAKWHIDDVVEIPAIERLAFSCQKPHHGERHIADPDGFANRIAAREKFVGNRAAQHRFAGSRPEVGLVEHATGGDCPVAYLDDVRMTALDRPQPVLVVEYDLRGVPGGGRDRPNRIQRANRLNIAQGERWCGARGLPHAACNTGPRIDDQHV